MILLDNNKIEFSINLPWFLTSIISKLSFKLHIVVDSVKSGDFKEFSWAFNPIELEFRVGIVFGISSNENVTHDICFFLLERLLFKMGVSFGDNGSMLININIIYSLNYQPLKLLFLCLTLIFHSLL